MDTNFAILQKFIAMEVDVTFDGLIDFDFAEIAYSTIETSPYENFALINKVLSDEERIKIEQRWKELKRDPAILFEKRAELQPFIETLKAQGYTKAHEDSWMFHPGEHIDHALFDTVKKVENEADLELFLQTMDQSYQKDDPQNPFGELGEYLTITKEAWRKHHQSGRLEYFMALKDGLPVATSSLNNFDNVGYISNVGSIREVRGQGFGKKTTLFAVTASVKNGNTLHCLTTEDGTYPNEFYKRLGFNTKFVAICYIKKNE